MHVVPSSILLTVRCRASHQQQATITLEGRGLQRRCFLSQVLPREWRLSRSFMNVIRSRDAYRDEHEPQDLPDLGMQWDRREHHHKNTRKPDSSTTGSEREHPQPRAASSPEAAPNLAGQVQVTALLDTVYLRSLTAL